MSTPVDARAGRSPASGPARTFTAKGLATRARIVDAAAELVFAHGVARTGVDDVQRAAGVRASQLYHVFTDKDDLIRAVIGDDDPLARAELVAGFERWEAPIRDGLARMREQGVLRPDTDTDSLALALLTALQGGLLLTQTRRDTAPLRVGLDTVIAQIRTYATGEPSTP